MNFVFILLIITSIQVGKNDPQSLYGGFTPFFNKLMKKLRCTSGRKNYQDKNINDSDSPPSKLSIVEEEASELYNEYFIGIIIFQYILAILYLLIYILVYELYENEDGLKKITSSKVKFSPLNWVSWLMFILILAFLM